MIYHMMGNIQGQLRIW